MVRNVCGIRCTAILALLLLAGCSTSDGPVAALMLNEDETTDTRMALAGLSEAEPSLKSSEQASVRFAPIIGAPLSASDPLTAGLRAAASRQNIAIRSFADETSDHVLKGYMAVDTSGEGTTVIYVWDVFDESGQRLHRIHGTTETIDTGDEGWEAISSDQFREIAERTLLEYGNWRNGTSA
ncbi:hypothetical protein [Pararhizobium haloflavum]|uniref:hypothetical protein n=1 Tax=Pararhizobium haloflavum TaxID=2037914 RepID=UPI000C1A3F65|nr:hypothetical protein [Pararhizobium haloflavum]